MTQVNPGGRVTRRGFLVGPDWAALDVDGKSGQVISTVDAPALAALLLDVSAA
jgi:hypothetical protein